MGSDWFTETSEGLPFTEGFILWGLFWVGLGFGGGVCQKMETERGWGVEIAG